ncbi:MAG: sulfotransferase [Bradyrhizobium sp.]|uniref:sulfotransferase family protein n=1 Tax=Bradyrhizobium sp. TaxID=376 RepID=UPI00272F1BC7|nr:sulfotransferase [Bradyrhizobium sp.]MDP1865956.1 sulfotransferase [Bradyrhizobium sp.]
MRQPVIFIGMHRSGTSMLGRLLESLGLFVGVSKDENNEAIFFQDINVWLLSQSGANWDVPGPIDYLWNNEEVLQLVEGYVRNRIGSPRSLQFLGIRRYAAGGFASLNSAWGWKDPRNTFTLPMWLRIFPEAKVVSIERNGVDVAQSLKVRGARELADAARQYERYRSVFFARAKLGGFGASPRCATLEGGFSLWREYNDRARQMIAKLPADRSLTLRYEDFLEEPIKYLRASAEFCGLQASDSKIRGVAASIKTERSRSYLSDPGLRHFADEHHAELLARGYGEMLQRPETCVGAGEQPRQMHAGSVSGMGRPARELAQPF